MKKKITYEKNFYEVKGDLIELNEKFVYDTETNEMIYDEKIERENDLNLYNNYRKKHGLLLPKEIKKIQKTYGISQTDLCKILGWGEKTITRYMNGSIQDKAHNNLLLLIKDNYLNFEKLLENNKESISEKNYKKYKERLEIKKICDNKSSNEKYLKTHTKDLKNIEKIITNSLNIKEKSICINSFNPNTYTSTLPNQIKGERIQ